MTGPRWPICILTVLAVSTIGKQSVAFEETPLPLDKKARMADLVIVGEVAGLSNRVVGEIREKFAKVTVTATLKGQSLGSVSVMYSGPISELNPNCCEVGRSYVFFLRNFGTGEYESADGRFGIYPIGSQSMTQSQQEGR